MKMPMIGPLFNFGSRCVVAASPQLQETSKC
ncbi:Uncharacterised protein [Paucimonas lemoignei]|nr:Uncharacterised protein [Paucimonas lemoignei]